MKPESGTQITARFSHGHMEGFEFWKQFRNFWIKRLL